MKLKSRINTDDRLEFDMTPMIDCCFQLIIFFMVTLRYAQPEGDFDIQMPWARPRPLGPTTRLAAGPRSAARHAAGGLAGIQLNQRPWPASRTSASSLRSLAGGAGPGSGNQSPEVEFDCDYNLKFAYTIQAITAVSGYSADDGQTIVKLCEKIKFAAPRSTAAARP